jgi:NADP-dependent aldehyde dehydrogenase
MSETEMTAGRQFIAGRRVASGEATLLSLKAVDGEATGHRFYPASREEAALAAQAAAQALPPIRNLAETRALSGAIADELDALGESFLPLPMQETALPLARLQGERARTSGQLRMFAGVFRRGDVRGRALIPRCRRVNPAAPGSAPVSGGAWPGGGVRRQQLSVGLFHRRRRYRLGAGGWLPGGGEGPSGPYGNRRADRAGHRAGGGEMRLARRVFNMIFGTDIGAELVRHPAIQAVGFTGSLAVRRCIQLAQQRPQPIPLFAEMSAINPLIILPQALQTRAEALAKELVASFTLGGGQFCTRPGLILALAAKGWNALSRAVRTVQAAPAQVCSMRRPCSTIAPVSSARRRPRISGWRAVKRPAAGGRRRCCTRLGEAFWRRIRCCRPRCLARCRCWWKWRTDADEAVVKRCRGS